MSDVAKDKWIHPPYADSSTTLLDAIDFDIANNSKHALFSYVDPASDTVETITWGKAGLGIRTAGNIVRRDVGGDGDSSPVAILATADSITYFTFMTGAIRAGYTPFPLSPRNSPAAIAHLIESTGTRHVYVSTDPASQDTVKSALKLLNDKTAAETLKIHNMPTFQDLYQNPLGEDQEQLPEDIKGKKTRDSRGVILHSSGSTSFPKPIPITIGSLMEIGIGTFKGELDFSTQIQGSHVLPMFHMSGTCQIPCAAFNGVTLAFFPPATGGPPVIPTPDRVWEDSVKGMCTSIAVVPVFLEVWFRNPLRRERLKGFDMVTFAGGPLVKSVGDALVAEGVKIAPVYAMTETGTISTILPKAPPKEGWAYWSVAPHLDPVLVPFDEKDKTFRLLLRKCATHTPSVLNTTIDGVPALDTNDLVITHPTNPKLLQIFGRADEQIMHSTGEKTNPIPIEGILSSDPHIENSIMFGREKFHAGVIITPRPDFTFDPSNGEKLAEFRNLIWSTVEKANNFAPSHSRLLKEMILVTHPSKPFEFTAKRTPQRKKALESYKEEIEACYQAFEQSEQTHVEPPSIWDADTTLDFCRQIVSTVGLSAVGDEDDLFQHGCDSLQATFIRNTIIHSLRTTTKVDTRAIPVNFVYDNPTARALASFVIKLVSQDGEDSEPEERLTDRLVKKYSMDFIPHRPSNVNEAEGPRDGEVLLITGTTGGLGSYLLSQALLNPAVTKVYALNRTSTSTTLKERQRLAFNDKDIDPTLLDSSKLVFLEGDLTTLSDDLVAELRRQVTHIIHNAWIVNFNLSLASMEPLLASLRKLVDFALSSTRPVPPRFVFTSTIGVFRNFAFLYPDALGPEGPIVDSRVPQGQGYGESKWCAEHILDAAHQASPSFSPVIIRVGQLCGSRESGTWNTNEWFPSLVKSSLLVGKLPRLAGDVEWVPIDVAAKVVLEVRNVTADDRYLNLVNPSPAEGDAVFGTLASSLGLPVVPPAEWITALEGSESSDLTKNPALKLIDFFRALASLDGLPKKDGADAGLFKMPVSLERTRKASKELEKLREQGGLENDASKWVAYWKKVGYI